MADFESRVIFIPNAFKYNKPQSPNVIKSWASHWDEIPECNLKIFAYQKIKGHVNGLGEAFIDAFTKSIRKPNHMTLSNQEQEQDQEQDSLSSLQEDVISEASPVEHQNRPNCPHHEIIALYHEILPMCRQVRDWHKNRRRYLQSRWRENEKHQSLDWWKGFFEHVKQSDFLIGNSLPRDGTSPFIADLEWLVRPTNFTKVIEGKYHGRSA